MKVLQLGKFYPIRGGVEKVMYDLTRGLSERGIQCDMLCACLKEDMPQGGEIRFNDCGRVICLRSYRKVAATMLCPSMISWLRKHCRNYDVIHVHHPDPMACLALWLSGYCGPVVLHWHSDILKQKVFLKFYKPLQSWLVRRSDLILGTTPVYVAESPWLSGVQEKVACLPIGIDKLETTAAADGNEKIIFSLGRLVGYKGYEYLVKAAALLPSGYKVVIAGGGPLRQELQSLIGALGLEDKVDLLGFISDEEKKEWYGKCSLFCLSSVWKTEAFAIVQIEAMSCGKPVVATKIPGSGVSWVNKDGFSGLNVPPADPEALAEAIVAITSDPETYQRYCNNASARFDEMFTIGAMIDGCVGYYETLLKKI